MNYVDCSDLDYKNTWNNPLHENKRYANSNP